MAKKQTRRTVSISSTHYERTRAYAEAHKIPSSQLTEFALDQIMSNPLDADAFLAWNDRRNAEWQERWMTNLAEAMKGRRPTVDPAKPVAAQPLIAIRQPTEEDRVDCTGLFTGRRRGRPADLGSKSRQAAEAVLRQEMSTGAAADRFGITRAAVYAYVRRLQAEAAP